jgi:hypothetical protein
LAQIQRKAVEDARERTQWLVQLNRGRHGGESKSAKVTYRVSPLTGGLIREGGPSLRESGGNPLRHGRGRLGQPGAKQDDGALGGDDSTSVAFAPAAEVSDWGAKALETNGGASRRLKEAAAKGDRAERHYGDLNEQLQGNAGASSVTTYSDGAKTEPSSDEPANEMSVTTRKERPKSLAETRGVNWGLAPAARSSNPITRPIHIHCEGHKLILVADRADEPPVEIPLTQRTIDSIDLLAAAVQDRINNWGLAGRGMYWRPQLILQVGKSGEGRYADLAVLLADSGFDVKRSK